MASKSHGGGKIHFRKDRAKVLADISDAFSRARAAEDAAKQRAKHFAAVCSGAVSEPIATCPMGYDWNDDLGDPPGALFGGNDYQPS